MLCVYLPKYLLIVGLMVVPLWIQGQIEDCDGAEVICSDGVVSFNPNGNGSNDFDDLNNDPGCLLTEENQSAWYYFEFNTNMPPSSIIEFTIDPNGGFGEDYDFAIYGPNLSCDSLGEPIRCSFANHECFLCPQTGLGMGATDESEGAMDEDGFVAPMTVQPGEGFYMILDNWYGSSTGFELTWGGSAAPYLNCLADPACNSIVAEAGADIQVCQGSDPLQLSGASENTSGAETYSWTGTPQVVSFLDDPDIADPMLTIPADFNDTIELTLTVTDGVCIKEDFLTIIVSPTPIPEIEGEASICEGTSSELNLTESYASYYWSTNELTSTINADTSGVYSVTVTDANECEGVGTFALDVQENPTIPIPDQIQYCEGDSAILDAGTDLSNYLWSDNSSEQTLTVYSPGTYGLTVTNAAGCSSEKSISVMENPLPSLSILGNLEICPDGSTVLQVAPSFDSYQWEGGETTDTLLVTSPAEYSVTVQDNNGCFGEAIRTVALLPEPEVNIEGAVKFCQGSSTLLEATGPDIVSYVWSDNSDTPQISISQPGMVGVTITDSNGCINSDTMTISMDTLPDISFLSMGTQFCYGTSAIITPGSEFADYRWSDNSQNTSLEVFNEGIYGLTVTDDNGCEGSTNIPVSVLPLPQPSILGTLGFCPDETTMITTESDWPEISWSNGSDSTSTVIDNGGQYSLTVVDSLGCIGDTTFQIEAFEEVVVDIAGADQFCPGTASTLDAGPGFVSYEWQDNSEQQTLSVSQPGTYEVTVTDTNGCSGEGDFEIDLFPVAEINFENTTFCEGESLTLSFPGDFESYEWSTQEVTPTITVSDSGTYNVTAIDSNGCQVSAAAQVQSLALPSVEITGDSTLCPGESAEFTATPGYAEYEWSENSQTTGITVNNPDTYSVTVTDENDCSSSADWEVIEFDQPNVDITGDLDFCQGTETTLQTNETFEEYLWSEESETPAITVGQAGVYSVTVIDGNNCTATDAVQVVQLTLPDALISTDTSFCEGETIILEATPSLANYEWSNEETGPTIEVEEPGMYSITVTDNNGCVNEGTLEVMENELPDYDPGPLDNNLTCYSPSTILGGEDPGNPNWTFQWTGPDIDMTNESLSNPEVEQEGLYTLLVTDELTGCVSEVYSVNVNDLINQITAVLSTSSDTLNCYEPNATLTSEGSDSGTNIITLWYYEGTTIPASQSLVDLEVDQPGLYELQVLDTLTGCSASVSEELISDLEEPVIITLNGAEITCREDTVSIFASIEQIEDELMFGWATTDGHIIEGADGLQPIVDESGTYEFTVLNVTNGCSIVQDVEVTENTNIPQANAGPDLELNCYTSEVDLEGESADGEALLYTWTFDGEELYSGEELISITVNQVGEYTLEIFDDSNGCFSLDDMEVTEIDNAPSSLLFSVEPPPCFGDRQGIIFVNEVEGGSEPYLYSLDGAPFVSDPIFGSLPSGAYTVTAQDINGCEIETEVFIEEGAFPQLDLGEDQTIDLGEEVTLYAQTNLSALQIETLNWSGPDLDCENCDRTQDVRPLENSIYEAKVVDENGCAATDQVRIIVNKPRDVFIPNAFSPNHDGINDIFMVFAGKEVSEIKEMLIHNRWGEQLFHVTDFPPNNPEFGWDGTFRGRELNNSVFVYMIIVEFVDGEEVLFEGDVSIIR